MRNNLRLLLAVGCLLVVGSVGGDLTRDVDDWLAEWYLPRLQVRMGLGGVAVSWTEGWVWRKERTLACSSGVLDLREAGFRRLGEPRVRPRVNSSRPLVSVDLAFGNATQRSGRFAFYNCSEDSGNSTGSVYGDVTASSPGPVLQISFSYKSVGWWCDVMTLGAGPLAGALRVSGMQLDGLSDIPKDASRSLGDLVLKMVFETTVRNWTDLAGDGPTCPDSYCKIKSSS